MKMPCNKPLLTLAAAGVVFTAGISELYAQDIIDYQAENDGLYGTATNWENSDIPDEGYGGSSSNRGEYAQFDGDVLGTSPLTVTVNGGPYTIAGLQVIDGAAVTLDMNGGTPLVTDFDAFGTPLRVGGSGSSLTVTNGTFDADQGSNDKGYVIESGGTLTVTGSGTLLARYFDNAGRVVVESGGQLTANSGNGFSGGEGRLVIKGGEVTTKWTRFDDSSVIEFELNNSDYGIAPFDAYRIDGLGDLAISLASGFSADVGDEFSLINSNASGVGAFDNIADGGTISAGAYTFELDVFNNDQDYRLITRAVPEPASLGLLVVGGLTLLGRGRRRA